MKNKLTLLTLALFFITVVYGQDNKPNIIVIMADDMGWGDVGYHGSKIKTPHIDKLAEEGVRLNRFYVAPVCSPTRAGLLTGRYPDRFGLRETVIPPWRDFGLDPSEEFLPELLAKAGYKNRAIIGKWHLGHSRQEYYPLNNGFTHFYGHLNGAINYFTHKREGELDWHDDYETSYDEGHATDLLSEDAVKSIKNYADEGPFFIYLAYNAPHTPLQAARQDLDQYGYDPSKPAFSNNPNKSEGRGNTEWQTYAAMVTGMDRGIGEILNTLEEFDIEDNTLVLFFSDNGADEGGKGGTSGVLRGHKFHEWEGGVRVPAIIKWPNGFEGGGRVVDQVTGYVDVMPTLSSIVSPGYEPERPWDGINVLPVLQNEKRQINRYFYLGSGAILNQDWKYIQANRNSRMPLEEDVLFNISADPYEENNIIASNKEKADQLKKALMQYDTIQPPQEVLPYHVGRKGFKAPKEWDLFRNNP
jgi:arylsulfatase B